MVQASCKMLPTDIVSCCGRLGIRSGCKTDILVNDGRSREAPLVHEMRSHDLHRTRCAVHSLGVIYGN